MRITPQIGEKMGVEVTDFDPLTATADELAEVKQAVYDDQIVVLKNQQLTPAEFVAAGRRFGEVEAYYEPMYHHPEEKEIFVSSNVPDADSGQQIGVPKTGRPWHADYSFMVRPVALTFIYPQVVPKKNRGTLFIDMCEAYENLSPELKDRIAGTYCMHSPRRHFKIRPSDVYRPIGELYDEIEQLTPPARHPTTFTHPVTKRTVLYASEGLTYAIEDADGKRLDDGLLRELLAASGQFDSTLTNEHIHLQTFTEGDLLIWDNRRLVHRAMHTPTPEPTVSFRVTTHDDHPFYDGTPV